MAEQPPLNKRENAEASPDNSLPALERIKQHAILMWRTCLQGLFSGSGLLYLALTVGGVGWATYFVPTINDSEISPETLGIYVTGLIVTLFAEALFTWKKGKEDSVAITVMVASLILGVVAMHFSTKGMIISAAGVAEKTWKPSAQLVLFVVLLFAILFWLALNAVDPKLDTPVTPFVSM